ncbi:hypothetical protein EMPG_12468 [Blastomyces silverae]|uniref:Helicase C-terminal domain-containing protein n=1 Tax=Blastomyces silverae TaxID=2060906 RepID=A0A0H1BTV3_9EURO|nr:hypothetical protein EMPG_12468 [Blastomyces silverae]
MTLDEQENIIDAFNDGKKGYKVLLFSFQSDFTELNLHQSLINLIMMKVPVNMNTLLQIISCVHHLRQIKKQKI